MLYNKTYKCLRNHLADFVFCFIFKFESARLCKTNIKLLHWTRSCYWRKCSLMPDQVNNLNLAETLGLIIYCNWSTCPLWDHVPA